MTKSMTNKIRGIGFVFAIWTAACADVDDPNPYIASQDDTDSAATQTADTIAADTGTQSTVQAEEPTVPTIPRVIGEECVAPDRDDFMARYGVTMDDDDLSDPNVVAAKRHMILFIFDKSGSMAGSWNEDGGSKWDIARDAMLAAVEPFQEYLGAGALFFPLPYGADPVAFIDSGRQINYNAGGVFMQIWDQNMEMYTADGGTPLMAALEAANDAIAHACEISLLTLPFKVVLLTDGMPDYWDSQRGLELIKNWYDRGIPTTVMGMPGSADASQLLSDIADVGSGGELDVNTGNVLSEGTADEILYDNNSSYDDIEGDLLTVAE